MSCHACGAPATVRDGQHCARCLLIAAVGGEEAMLISATDEAPACELLSPIGDTPRATTFLAEQTWPLRRLVALKLFKNDFVCTRPQTRERRDLPRHPNIANVIERGRIAGRPYVVTEYLAGGPITSCYDRHQLGSSARIEAGIHLSAALAFAHAHGIVHGHLIASNVLCEPRAPCVAKIVDFESAATVPDGHIRTFDVLIRADLEDMIDLVAALTSSPMAGVAPDERMAQAIGALRGSTRSAAELRERLQQLHAETADQPDS